MGIYTRDTVLAEVVPPWNGVLPTAGDYRRDFDVIAEAREVLGAPAPAEKRRVAQPPVSGEASLEGYLAARLVVLARERMGLQPTPAGLDGYNLGIGVPNRRPPSEQDLVRFTTLRRGAPVELADFSEWRR